MSLGEFDLIKDFFQTQTLNSKSGVSLGIGDDCAILDIPEGHQLAVTTDTLVCDVHFFADVDPFRLGYKSLAVNLSDLAAMGATPKWVSLAITLPDRDDRWLAEFSRGFFELANKFNVSLVGGDTTKGPLSITISAKGIIPRGAALQRNMANAGDLICVSGNVGDGAIGLACKLNEVVIEDNKYFIDALELTQPRVELGLLLRALASSCIDISDGLTQDLTHILKASHCRAQLEIDKLPLSPALIKEVELATISHRQALQYALTGGDDYELLFTISAENLSQLHKAIQQQPSNLVDVTVIGTTAALFENLLEQPIIELFEHKQPVSFVLQGWDHFQQGKN